MRIERKESEFGGSLTWTHPSCQDHQGVEHRNLSLHVQALRSIFDKILCSRNGASIQNQRQRQTAQESLLQFFTTLGYWFLLLQLCNCSKTLTKCKFAMLRK
jgi:hypothetical protein